MREFDKYYKPKDEEFHVGFEFEESWGLENVNEEWIEGYFSGDCSIEDLCLKTRVKYLDQKDIESFGFKYYDMLRDGGTKLFEKEFHGQKVFLDYYGENVLTGKNLRVRIYTNNRSGLKGSFDGEIKNKSELGRVLKMIGYEL